jgi:hypothetical protein
MSTLFGSIGKTYGIQWAVILVPIIHQSPKYLMAESIRYTRCQPVPPVMLLSLPIKEYTGDFMINCKKISDNKMDHRTARMWSLMYQQHTPMTKQAYAMAGPLEAHRNVISVVEITPITANIRSFSPLNQSPRNIGANVTPNVPARIGWVNGPWHLKRPSRIMVYGRTDPKYENKFFPVNFSKIIKMAIGIVANSINRIIPTTSSISLTSSLHNKYNPKTL